MKVLKMVPLIILTILVLVGVGGGVAFTILVFAGFFEPLAATL